MSFMHVDPKIPVEMFKMVNVFDVSFQDKLIQLGEFTLDQA